MKSKIRFIGIIDNDDFPHFVRFNDGVNVVTGRSSTGKSAIIEIFDYCFGSSDFTVPAGIITKASKLYYVVMDIGETTIVIARDSDVKGRCFLKEENMDEAITTGRFHLSYFNQDHFMPLIEFKKLLGLRFGLNYTDVDESLFARENRRNKRKSATPSIRSFTSFILQHQNLVANKHAIFYRFDESEKRSQVIDHFKIFAGFVDQEFFTLSQDLETLLLEKLRIERALPKNQERKENFKSEVEFAIEIYKAASGANIETDFVEKIISNPTIALNELSEMRVEIIPMSGMQAELRSGLEMDKSQREAELRKAMNRLNSIRSSIRLSENYETQAKSTTILSESEIHVTTCPFCYNEQRLVEKSANRLVKAIDWLNGELSKTPALLYSLKAEEKKYRLEIERLTKEIIAINAKTSELEQQITDLEKHKSQYEISLKAKFKLESIIKTYIANLSEDSRLEIKALEKKIEDLRKKLDQYGVQRKIKHAEDYISEQMNRIGAELDFEESYKPINLHFSLETFDLWHENSQNSRVYLRAMGSGANWLYSHICLFLALHRYFCSLKAQCSIPSILFIDQPSQVYFPSVLDKSIAFEANQNKSGEYSEPSPSIDEDMKSVTNLFSQLVRFCLETKDETGIEPQVIITDHADYLDIKGNKSWEELVDGRRWRGKSSGFIQEEK